MSKFHVFSIEARLWVKTLLPIAIAWLHGYTRPQPKWAQKKTPEEPKS